jgi:hypothetical protein
VRGFHNWLKAGRVVMKGEKGIRPVASDTVDDGQDVGAAEAPSAVTGQLSEPLSAL